MKKLLFTVLMAVLARQVACAETLTYVNLIERLTNLERLAVLPAAGDSCAQWSSYDRKSTYDAKTDTYHNWEANGDGDGFIRRERGGIVMAEMKGPGCIWRIWSAKAGDGHVLIYLDGNEQPAVDLPFSSYFDGKNEPFTRPALVNKVSQGLNCYIPISYQKSCKIIAKRGWGQYFHFTYETFPPETIVPTFKRSLSKEENAALDKANAVLSDCANFNTEAGQQTVASDTVTVEPGKNSKVELQGEGAITRIRIKPELPGDVQAQRAMMREMCIRAFWDGQKEPAVWCPLGDFFGTAPGVNLYSSLPLGMTKDGFYSNWVMPFADGAVLEIINDGNMPRTVTYEIWRARLTKPAAEYGRFHAKWHRDAFLPDKKKWAIDWTMLTTKGRGRFCGVMLHVWNPLGGWWGEGDEKFYVDDEKFPSTFGTGSEDYFGYAWCDPALFQNAYHDQTINSRGWNFDHISVNRWHITDNVPFAKSFDAYIEKYYPNNRPTLYACTAYWYLSADGSDRYKAVELNDRLNYYVGPSFPWVISGIKVLAMPTVGTVQPQDMQGWGKQWRDNDQVWWTDGKPGSKLQFAMTVKEAGKYDLEGVFTKAPDYAIIQFYVDDEKIGKPLDLYNGSGVICTPMVNIGSCTLSQGQHTVTAEIVGKNPKAVGAYMVGIDELKLSRVLW